MTFWTAWAVHAYTASGALMGLAGILAAASGDVRGALIWMFAATVVDGTDGIFARAARVKERTPAFDGARLDDIVDYLTFVFLPAFVVATAGLLPDELRWPAAAAMLLSSAYGFASLDAKTSDYFFTGFPSYWNVVVLYLVVLGLPLWANAAVVFAFAILVFVRIGYVYPTRTPSLRRTTLALMALWALMLLLMIWWLPGPSEVEGPAPGLSEAEGPPRWLVLGSLVFPVYYAGLSFVLNARRPAPPPASSAEIE